MKHILDCIGALRFIHKEYSELLVETETAVSFAKDEVFMEAVSLSMTGIFDIPRRDLRVDLLCHAFPGRESEDWFPLHWAMLAGASIDEKSVEIIYNDDPMVIEQYHQQPIYTWVADDQDILSPRECWTPAHFLCVAINSGPNLLGQLKKYIMLNANAFTKSPLGLRDNHRTYGVLHIAAKFCKDIAFIREIVQLNKNHLVSRDSNRCKLTLTTRFVSPV